MSRKYVFLCILLCGLLIGIIIIKNSNDSFAYSYLLDKSVLFYKEDVNELKSDICDYLEELDDIIIPNSSFLYSDVLGDNYDFLVNFAIDYVLHHKEAYQDEIKTMDFYSYYDRDGNFLKTNQYVAVDVIYEITDRFFGIRDFVMIHDNAVIRDGYLSLSDYSKDDFNLEIQDVSIQIVDNMVLARVSYAGHFQYVYTFSNVNKILKIRNVEVIE